MPHKKDWGPATRSSNRLSTTTDEESEELTITPNAAIPLTKEEDDRLAGTAPVNIEPRNALPSHETTYHSADELSRRRSHTDIQQTSDAQASAAADSGTPSEASSIRTMNPADQSAMHDMAALLARMSALERVQNDRTRGTTPDNSAFGGQNFQPIGLAAKRQFQPFGNNQDSVNPEYDNKQRESRLSPPVFADDKSKFKNFIIKLGDKVARDRKTFPDERSMMAVLFDCTEGRANKLLEHRYNSEVNPFKSLQEMVATLEAIFTDAQAATNAARQLAAKKFDFTTEDIHDFIADVNNLADESFVPLTHRKNTLFTCLPGDFDDQGTLAQSVHKTTVSYEDFVEAVTYMAHGKANAYKARLARRQAGNHKEEKKSGSALPRLSSWPRREPNKEVRSETIADRHPSRPTLNIDKLLSLTREDAQAKGLCWGCGQPGHVKRDCPNKAAVVAALSRFDDSDAEDSMSSDMDDIPGKD